MGQSAEIHQIDVIYERLAQRPCPSLFSIGLEVSLGSPTRRVTEGEFPNLVLTLFVSTNPAGSQSTNEEIFQDCSAQLVSSSGMLYAEHWKRFPSALSPFSGRKFPLPASLLCPSKHRPSSEIGGLTNCAHDDLELGQYPELTNGSPADFAELLLRARQAGRTGTLHLTSMLSGLQQGGWVTFFC